MKSNMITPERKTGGERMKLDMRKLIEEEERRLKVGDPEFLKRHGEIMKQCDALEEGQHCNRNSPQRLKNSPRMDLRL